jgi:hypothetical protein
MNHRALKARVAAAERRVDAHLSAAVQSIEHAGQTTRAAATPMRIIVTGLLGGYLIGRLRPMRGTRQLPNLFRATMALVPLFDTFAPLMAGLRDAARNSRTPH